MKARRFFAFVAGAALLFGAVGCENDDAEAGDTSAAEITVSPTEIAATLAEGGEYNLTVTSNAAWVVSCDQSDVTIDPMAGAGNATVKVTIPSATVARNFSIGFEASKEAMMSGFPYISKANASVAVYQNVNGDTSIATNVAEVRALLTAMSGIPTGKDDAGIAVTDEIAAMTLTGIVVGEPNGNMGNNYLFAVQDDATTPGGGLTINHDKAKDMKKGQVVTFSLAGATVKYYYGLLQVSASNSESLTVVGEPVDVKPIEIAYADFLSYESQYVKINNVTPSTDVIGKVWNSTTKGVNVNFTTAEGQTLVVRVSGYASFKNDIIPSKSGALCGVAGRYNSDKQLMPQYASDIQLTEDIVAPEAEVVTIAQIEKAGLYKVENAWVAGFNGNGPILTDASGAYINTYIHQHNYKTIGQKMTIEGAVTVRQGGFQFEAPTVTVLDGTAEVVYPENPTVYEGEALVALCEKFLTGTYLAEYAAFKGVLEYDGTYYNLVFAGLDGAKYKGSLSKTPDESLGLAALSGTPVTLKGFVVDYGNPYLSIVPTSVEVDENAKILAAEAITNVPKDGVTDAIAEITVIGIDAVTTEVDGTVVTAASVEGNILTYSVSANTDKAREGWIKLSAEGVETVTVVVKQSSALAYDYKSDAAFVNSDSTYGAAGTANGSEMSGFKLGTGKLSGYFESKPVAVEGDVTLEFYAVAWKGKSATLYVRKQGSTDLIGQFALKANEGAANQAPYTMTLTDDDYYTVSVPGITADTVLEFATDESFTNVSNSSSGRAIVVGVHLLGGTPSTPTTPEPEQPTVKTLPYIEAFATGQGDFTINDILLPEGSTYVWKWTTRDNVGYMQGSAFVGSAKASESLLVSPEINLNGATAPELTFSHLVNYANGAAFADILTLWVKETTATEWAQLTIPTHGTGSSWDWVESGAIDLSAYVDKSVNIAFKYTSDTTTATTWRIKDFKVAEKGATVEPEQPGGGETPDTPVVDENAYQLTLADIKSITYAADWANWTKDAVDGSSWSGFAYKQTNYYQFSWKAADATANQNLAHILCPAVPAGKKITKITITPDASTTKDRKFVVLPADFEYTTAVDANATEAINAAYAVSEPTVKESTTPIVIDLSGVANLPQQVQIRSILGAAYVTNIKVSFE